MRMFNRILTKNDISSIINKTSTVFIQLTTLPFIVKTPVMGTDVIPTLNGKAVDIVEFESADEVGNVGKFTMDTSYNIYIVASQTDVVDICSAGRYITGFVVSYNANPLQYFDNVPTYVLKTYDVNNYLVCETLPCDLPTLMNKIKCIDSGVNVGETGPYQHVLVRSLTTQRVGG